MDYVEVKETSVLFPMHDSEGKLMNINVPYSVVRDLQPGQSVCDAVWEYVSDRVKSRNDALRARNSSQSTSSAAAIAAREAERKANLIAKSQVMGCLSKSKIPFKIKTTG